MDPILSTVVGALIGAIVAMWKKLSADNTLLSRRTDECEKDRAGLRGEVTELKEDMAVFKTCGAEPCGARDALLRQQSFNKMLRYEHDNLNLP